jgi:hypothetical protein
MFKMEVRQKLTYQIHRFVSLSKLTYQSLLITPFAFRHMIRFNEKR